jgi:hypothetical protein
MVDKLCPQGHPMKHVGPKNNQHWTCPTCLIIRRRGQRVSRKVNGYVLASYLLFSASPVKEARP